MIFRENAPKVIIRSGTSSDLLFLKQMLFEAAYWRPEIERPLLEDGLSRSDLVYLLEDWGRDGDTAVIAIYETGQPVGAAWYRFWDDQNHSYGYISPEIPELAIAVHPEFRRMGIGHQLLDGLIALAAAKGVPKISLSVEIDNPALHLYRQHGFKVVEQLDNAWTMFVKTM